MSMSHNTIRYTKRTGFFEAFLRPLMVLGLMSFSTMSFSGVSSDMDSFFNGLGYSSNSTASNAYQGQEAGYYSGGSVFLRDSVKNVQLADVDLPKFRAGCGGIDLYSGGFSYINSDELSALFNNIMSNATGFATELALESTLPEANGVMKYLNTLASSVNSQNIKSCETAAGLVGSVWPRTQEAQQKVCEAIGTDQGLFSDYAAARQGCGPKGNLTRTLNSATGPYKNMALLNGNLAWKALTQNDFTSGDNELKEFMMTLSGTVIMKHDGNTDDGDNAYKILPSLAGNQQLIKALLHGGEAKIYTCGDDSSADGCLNPSLQTLKIDQAQALSNQVSALLKDMVNKIVDPTDQSSLTPTEKGLLNSTRLPIYKILNVQSAFYGSSSILNVEDYADVIALDILSQYLDETFIAIKSSASQMAYPESLMTPFIAGIDKAREEVRTQMGGAYAQVNAAAQLIQQAQGMEQMLAGQVATEYNGSNH
jgi:conjugative transfer pilus assembly protein TraH